MVKIFPGLPWSGAYAQPHGVARIPSRRLDHDAHHGGRSVRGRLLRLLGVGRGDEGVRAGLIHAQRDAAVWRVAVGAAHVVAPVLAADEVAVLFAGTGEGVTALEDIEKSTTWKTMLPVVRETAVPLIVEAPVTVTV